MNNHYIEFDYKDEDPLRFYDCHIYRLEKDIDLDMTNAIINIVERWSEEYKDELRKIKNE